MPDPSHATCADAAARLPTLQRNALRMLLGRREFTPAEVAAIDHAILERSERIGPKGLAIIRGWLKHHGYAVASPPVRPVRDADFHRRRRLEKAIAVIRSNGYGLVMPEDAA